MTEVVLARVTGRCLVSDGVGRFDPVECSDVIECGDDEIDNASSISFWSFASMISFSDRFCALVCLSFISRSAPRFRLASEVDIAGGELDLTELICYRETGMIEVEEFEQVRDLNFRFHRSAGLVPFSARAIPFSDARVLRNGSDVYSRRVETLAHMQSKAYPVLPDVVSFGELILQDKK